MIIYIAGPMSGLKGFNLDSFNLAESVLKAQGHEVRNPACLGHGWADYEHYMEIDLVMLGQCDAIAFLPGSENSAGAQREAAYADKFNYPIVTGKLDGVRTELQALFITNGVNKNV